jgi:hypothetical protein
VSPGKAEIHNFRRLIPAKSGHKNLSSKTKPDNAGGFYFKDFLCEMISFSGLLSKFLREQSKVLKIILYKYKWKSNDNSDPIQTRPTFDLSINRK